MAEGAFPRPSRIMVLANLEQLEGSLNLAKSKQPLDGYDMSSNPLNLKHRKV